MKKVILGAVLASVATVAMAETGAVTPYIEAERAFEAQTNAFAAGALVEVPYGIVTEVRVNTLDDQSEARFEFESAELNFTKDFTDNVGMYVENTFDRDWDHAETVVGVRVTFN